MTRQEFIDDITYIGDLVRFCDDVGCDICGGVYDDEARDDYLDQQVCDWAHDEAWYELRDMLDNIPTGYDWWIINDYGDWNGIDDDEFDRLKDDVLDWADERGVFEDDDDDDEDHTIPNAAYRGPGYEQETVAYDPDAGDGNDCAVFEFDGSDLISPVRIDQVECDDELVGENGVEYEVETEITLRWVPPVQSDPDLAPLESAVGILL